MELTASKRQRKLVDVDVIGLVSSGAIDKTAGFSIAFVKRDSPSEVSDNGVEYEKL